MSKGAIKSVLKSEFGLMEANIYKKEVELIFWDMDSIYLGKHDIEALIQELTELKDKMI